MDFYAVVDQVLDLLRQRGRVTYRALKRHFDLDDAVLEDLKAEIIEAHRLAVDEDGKVLVWTGDAAPAPPPAAVPEPPPEWPPLDYTPKHLAEKILTARASLEGERKQVTVFFVDIKDSTRLIEGLDPEAAQQLLDPAIQLMMDAVHRFEGTVNQVLGDGIMALFGAPIAHEDHALRACYAALALQSSVRPYAEEVRRRHGLALQLRVGLNAGEVVVRAIGNDLHMDYSAVGQTTHLAARMEQLATPGSILLTAATLRLVEGLVQVNALGPVPVKGLTDPVEVFELAGASALRQRLQAAAARGLTRFVGRQTELAALQQALERAEAGHGQVVALVGEAGVGKSRLVYEFVHTPQMQGWRVLESASVAYGSLLLERRRALHARIVEALEALAGDGVAEQVEHLAHHALRGEVWDKALAYCWQMGEKAMARSAHREAVGYFEQALSALAHLPEARATRKQAIDLRLALRSALFPSGDSGRILAVLREAESLAATLDDPRRLGQVSGFLSIHFLSVMGGFDQAIAAAQRALALAKASGDVVLHALANRFLGEAYRTQGDYRRAIDYYRQTVASLEGTRRRERVGQVTLPAVRSRANLAMCHAELGTFAEGSILGDEGRRIAEAADHPGSLMFASWGVGLLFLCQGDLRRAVPLLERAMGLCQEADLPVYFPWMAAALGAAYTLGGRIADAMPLLTQAMEQTITTARIGSQALCSLPLGEAQMLAGRLEEAHALAERALALAREHQERGNEAYALRLLGDIAARREPPESVPAEAHYRQALVLAEELGMRPLQAHCHLGLGPLYAKIDQREQARAELPAAIDLYHAMDMTFWLPQAEASLAQVV
jgi:class 3 adenylate cyclase